jgi:hypothetical protein
MEPVAPRRLLSSPGGGRIAWLFYKNLLSKRLDALSSAQGAHKRRMGFSCTAAVRTGARICEL